jgi:energy-coupling factor transporter ATP-binding protein EcfA2
MPPVEEEIANWLNNRPYWTRALAAHVLDKPIPDQATIETLARQLVGGQPIDEIASFTAADVPSTISAGARVELLAVGDIENVNALKNGSALSFGTSGVTVIYGDNGSGKSGFARLLKEVVGARHHQSILPNAFDPTATKNQSAKITYKVDGDERLLDWPVAQDTLLTQVHFYDEACGDHYLLNDSELTYRPSALAFLDDLIRATDRLREVLDIELSQHNGPAYVVPGLSSGTQASLFLESLSASVSDHEVDVAVSIPQNSEVALADLIKEEARLHSTSPVKERARLNAVAAALELIADHLDTFDPILSPAAAQALDEKLKSAHDLRAAADLASRENFTDEPLDGVGTQTWRSLWAAAEAYSTSEAYHDHGFPFVGEGALCPLCQQRLDADGVERLSRFKAFIQDETATRARDAETQAQRSAAAVSSFTVTTVEVATSLATVETTDAARASEIRTAIEAAEKARDRIIARVSGDTDEAPLTLGSIDTKELRTSAETSRVNANAIDATLFAEQLETTTREKLNLADRIELAKHADALKREVARLRAVQNISATRGGITTQAITVQSTALTRKHVTEQVNDRFARESDRLGLEHVKLDDRGGDKGKLRHKPALLGSTLTTKSVRDVLSEGEQTALGLAGLLTEVHFDASKSTLVLDDPITSLDHGRREKVAKRIARLSRERQVVVFTHDLTFLGDLIRAARDEDIPLEERSIIKDGAGVPGHVLETHPWKAKDAKKRIGELREQLVRLKKEQVDLDPEEHSTRVQFWAGRLSETWERVVRNDIIGKVVDRGTTEVRPTMIKLLARITDADNTDFQSGYSQVSKWAPRHDKSEEVNFVVPTNEELDRELSRLEEWYKRIVKYAQ